MASLTSGRMLQQRPRQSLRGMKKATAQQTDPTSHSWHSIISKLLLRSNKLQVSTPEKRSLKALALRALELTLGKAYLSLLSLL